jgi:crotonobetainyl-CoA:carnitine CoA-transferase CaiB-like acyl-CoA transferase
LIGLPDLHDDPRYVNTVERSRHRDALIRRLQEAFLTKSYEDWEKLLLENDIPVGAINNIAQVVELPQVRARRSCARSTTRASARCASSAAPCAFPEPRRRLRLASPITVSIRAKSFRAELGLTSQEIRCACHRGRSQGSKSPQQR